MNTSTLLFLYVFGLLAILAGVSRYCDLRRRRFEPEPTEDKVFRCIGCSYVYTDDPDVDRSRCPQCGRVNETFKF
jgi:rubrerythrin